MALDFLLSKNFKESSAFDSLTFLLDQDDFFSLKNLYCGKNNYDFYRQGETISYETEYPHGHETVARIKTYDNKEIECKIYNHHNNIKIKRRDCKRIPMIEDEHVFSYDYKTGLSTVSSIKKEVFCNKDKEYFKVTQYQKAVFNEFGHLIDFDDQVREYDKSDKKRRKY